MVQQNNDGIDSISSVVTGRVAYNLGSQQLEIIGNLLQRASNSLYMRDPFGYYNALFGVKMQIIARLKPHEKVKLAEYEKKINACFNNTINVDDMDQSNSPKIGMSFQYLHRYDAMLKRLLENRGYLVPSQTTQGVFGQGAEE